MVERLVTRWNVIENAKCVDADGEEEKEVLENSSLRLLTKEYVELLGRVMEKHSGNANSPTMTESSGPIVDIDMDDDVDKQGSGGGQSSELGEVGALLLSDPTCFMAIVSCIVS